MTGTVEIGDMTGAVDVGGMTGTVEIGDMTEAVDVGGMTGAVRGSGDSWLLDEFFSAVCTAAWTLGGKASVSRSEPAEM
jgi:hypothetical protein